MPFQSEKQRRYLHANHPEIAKRWERDYAGGGRIGFAEGPKTYEAWLDYRIKEIAAQRIPVPFKEWKKGDIKMNQGGFIPSHEAGIYGLAEGGNIRLQPHTASDLLVQKTSSGERPKYQPPGHGEGESKSGSISSDGPPGGGATSMGSGRDYSPSPSVFVGGSDQEEDVARMMSNMGITPDHSPDYSGNRGWVNPEDDRPGEDNRPWGGSDNRSDKDVAYDFDFMYGHEVKPKDQWNEHNKRNKRLETKQLAKDAFDAFKFGIGPFSMLRFAWGQSKKTKAKKEHLQKMIDDMKSRGAYYGPHANTPLQLAEQLMINLNTPNKKPVQDDGGDGVTGVASITYDDMEDTNKKELASSRWRQEQEKVDRSKQLAYWRMMMQPYMSAKGGRVPGGYNTGGLSNLFRLKNT